MEKKETAPGNRTTKVLDWAEVLRRLEIAQAEIGQRAAQTPEEKKRILKARAKALAREPEEQIAGDQYLEVVEFLLAHENYAIESSYVREVYPLKELTPLPGTPAAVLGVTSVRGQILSVIDLKKFFELPEKGLTDLNKVIVIHSDAMELGILADAVLGVRSIPLKDVQQPLSTLTGLRSEYLKGVTKERLVLLDVGKILSDKNIGVHEEA